VVDRRRDSGGDAGQANLADPSCAKFVNFFVGEVEEMDVDRWCVGVYRVSRRSRGSFITRSRPFSLFIIAASIEK